MTYKWKRIGNPEAVLDTYPRDKDNIYRLENKPKYFGNFEVELWPYIGTGVLMFRPFLVSPETKINLYAGEGCGGAILGVAKEDAVKRARKIIHTFESAGFTVKRKEK